MYLSIYVGACGKYATYTILAAPRVRYMQVCRCGRRVLVLARGGKAGRPRHTAARLKTVGPSSGGAEAAAGSSARRRPMLSAHASDCV